MRRIPLIGNIPLIGGKKEEKPVNGAKPRRVFMVVKAVKHRARYINGAQASALCSVTPKAIEKPDTWTMLDSEVTCPLCAEILKRLREEKKKGAVDAEIVPDQPAQQEGQA